MDRKLIFRLAAISSITIGSFIGGINYERNRSIKLINQTSNPYLIYASDDLKKVSASVETEKKQIFNFKMRISCYSM